MWRRAKTPARRSRSLNCGISYSKSRCTIKPRNRADFTGHLQTALFAFSAHDFPTEKNRGVRKAPFVVLIGANMPSVLAEIGFLSNPKEEMLLKKSDYRQKLAESLFRGISKYAEGLSHFQMAKTSATPPHLRRG